ncbi:DUF3180 domain-containing protein [Nakamurella antarctica]|uniref:DUF3180 domain-containing protein n=1 Tax=Nakamurella antarctica TaxID=1902245 RepID=A0A3G8ZQ35_9ACTN|nr:DUF3180 domain-containing protein [Nakamurella antarctica]AZI58915.1 DUF3180 domain-containing protein [Nakamurella antarctica]
MSRDDDGRMGLTRWRDLAAVSVLATLASYALVRWQYGNLPQLPRFAGISAALVGLGEAAAGFTMRSRLGTRGNSSLAPNRAQLPTRTPIPPLVAARALMVAKATALAGAGVVGLWLGLVLYVTPHAADLRAASADSATGTIGLVGALIMVAGALWLERSCVAPPQQDPPRGGDDVTQPRQ